MNIRRSDMNEGCEQRNRKGGGGKEYRLIRCKITDSAQW